MPHSYQILVNGSPADAALYDAFSSLEIEENAELPAAISLSIPVSRSEQGDLTYVNDAALQPCANLAVVATVEGQPAQCIFDGYVLAHKLHLETGTTSSRVEVWGQDASFLMNLEEKTREWVNVTDGAVANAIFGEYGIGPAPDNTDDDSPSHTENGHTLMQRASDIQFLRQLARRNGKLCRVFCTERAGQRTGLFAKPRLDSQPVAVLALNHPTLTTVSALDFEWDVSVPAEVVARQASFVDAAEDGFSGDQSDSGLPLLDERGLADFSSQPLSMRLTTTVDDAGELQLRARSLLREAGFFVRCNGEAEVSRLGVVLRVGDLVQVDGAGSVHSGKYLVWSVRHQLGREAHRMRFVLVRNAVGPAAAAAPSLLGGLL